MKSKSNGKIICIGEAMVELSPMVNNPETMKLGTAGDVLNTAIYLQRFRSPNQVALATVVGADPFSDRMVEAVDAENIDTTFMRRHEERVAGLYAISTDEEGERTFTYWRGQSAARTMFEDHDDDLHEAIRSARMVYFSAITLAILSPAARDRLLSMLTDLRQEGGGQIAFDSNYRPALWEDVETARHWVERAWRTTDIALPSFDDESALFGDTTPASCRDRMLAYGARTGAVKRGSAGPLSIEPLDGSPIFTAAPRVVDTTAAGDSFNGGYLAGILDGLSQIEALQQGHALACKVIATPGAIMPAAKK